MVFVIDETFEIDAPVGVVWETITDLSRYGEWNPFVVACSSTLKVGDSIAMRVAIFSPFAQPQREMILEHIPGQLLCYGLAGSSLGALASRRYHEVHAVGPVRTRYRSHFELSGWLSPLMRSLLGARLARGFHSMSAAVGTRAEQLWAERSRSQPPRTGSASSSP